MYTKIVSFVDMDDLKGFINFINTTDEFDYYLEGEIEQDLISGIAIPLSKLSNTDCADMVKSLNATRFAEVLKSTKVSVQSAKTMLIAFMHTTDLFARTRIRDIVEVINKLLLTDIINKMDVDYVVTLLTIMSNKKFLAVLKELTFNKAHEIIDSVEGNSLQDALAKLAKRQLSKFATEKIPLIHQDIRLMIYCCSEERNKGFKDTYGETKIKDAPKINGKLI